MNSLFFIIAALLFAAFFSGMETAFVSAGKLRFAPNRKQEKFSSGIINLFTKRPGQYLSVISTGYIISATFYGIALTLRYTPVLATLVSSEILALLIVIVGAGMVFFPVAEYLPKILFRISPNVTFNVCAVPLLIFYGLLYPVNRILTGTARFFVGAFTGVKPDKNSDDVVFAKADIDTFIGEMQSVGKEERDAEHEIKIFRNALDFSSVKLRDCMIPRTDIVAVEEDTPIAELKQKFIDTGVSKIVVYHEDIDTIIGYVHSKELFKNPISVSAMLNRLTFVPETMSGNRMMQLFMQERRSIAIVVDEYGGTAGLLTLEDLIEEIFGDIEDEHDRDNLVERQISENEYLLSGRLEIEYINETFRLNIPERDDYDTLAGFILYHHLNFPLAGEMIRIEPYTFIIRKISNTRIDLVQMTIDK